jgi:hypothetical protein
MRAFMIGILRWRVLSLVKRRSCRVGISKIPDDEKPTSHPVCETGLSDCGQMHIPNQFLLAGRFFTLRIFRAVS